MPTDTTLTIRCPHCVAGIDFRPMIAHKDGRFVCRDCAHTVHPGEPEYKCICRPCLRLSRKRLRDAITKSIPVIVLAALSEPT